MPTSEQLWHITCMAVPQEITTVAFPKTKTCSQQGYPLRNTTRDFKIQHQAHQSLMYFLISSPLSLINLPSRLDQDQVQGKLPKDPEYDQPSSSLLIIPMFTSPTYAATSLFANFDFSVLFDTIYSHPCFSPIQEIFLLLIVVVYLVFIFYFAKGQLNPYSMHLSFIEILWLKKNKHYNNIITTGPCNPEQRGLWLLSRRAGAGVGNLET